MLNHRNANVNPRNCGLRGGSSGSANRPARPCEENTPQPSPLWNGCGAMRAPMPTPVSNNGCGCGCGCGQHANNDCQKLMQQIRTVDFALYEVVLYLDVYPDSCEALNTYHKLVARQKALHEQYQASCGPITASGNMSTTAWNWTDGPFPWEASANS